MGQGVHHEAVTDDGWFHERRERSRNGGWRDWTYVFLVIGLLLLALVVISAL